MKDHIHVGAISALTTFLALMPIFFLYRYGAAKLASSDDPLAQKVGNGMAFLF